MKKSEIHPAIRECMGAFEVFRRLGFAADEIFSAIQGDAALSILRTQGKEFVATVGKFDGEPRQFVKGWEDAAKAVNDGLVSWQDLREIYEESFVLQNSVSLLLALDKKGIVLPRADGMANPN